MTSTHFPVKLVKIRLALSSYLKSLRKFHISQYQRRRSCSFMLTRKYIAFISSGRVALNVARYSNWIEFILNRTAYRLIEIYCEQKSFLKLNNVK